MHRIFGILVFCALMRAGVLITLSLENTDTLEEPLLTDEFGRCGPDDSIDLSELGLYYIKDNMVKSKQIYSVYLNDNKIREIAHNAFQDVTELLCLDLSANKIPIERLLDFGHKKLKALDVSYQRADDRNREWADRLMIEGKKTLETTMFSYFPSLRYLDISGNAIYNLPANFSAVVPQLTHIYLKNRNFEDLSDNFFELIPKSLKSLHIENNVMQVIDFPDTLSIEGLFVNSNPLNSSGHHLASPFIKYLSLSNCTLDSLNPYYGNELSRTSIPDILPGNVPNLERLDLSYNNLENIEDILHLTTYNSLTMLWLSHNQLKVFPASGTFTALEMLSMSHNQISTIPDTISGFPSLKVLNLSGNQIQNIDKKAFYNMLLLEVLDLANNNLASLPGGWFEPLRHLRRLDVRHNKFVNIGSIFSQLPITKHTNLADLYVKSDALKTVDMHDLDLYLPASCVVHTC